MCLKAYSTLLLKYGFQQTIVIETTVTSDRENISLNMLGNPKKRKGKRKETLPNRKDILDENTVEEPRRETACPSIHEKDTNQA